MAFYITKPNNTSAVIVPEKNFYQELERATVRHTQATQAEYTATRTEAIAQLETTGTVTISGTKFSIAR